MPSPDRRERLAAALALFGPVFLACAPWLLGPACLYGDDFEWGYGPLYAHARAEFWSRGELPRWESRQYAGVPCLGNLQSNFYYPPNAVFLVLPMIEGFEVWVFLHLCLAAGGMYRLIRGFRLRRSAGVVAGLAYALSSAILGKASAGHVPYLAVLCLAPLFVHLLRRMLERCSWERAGALGLAGGVLLTGGNPQTIYHLLLLSAGVAVWVAGSRARRGEPWRVPALGALGALAWSGLASAVHLLPAFEVAALTDRRPAEGFYETTAMPVWHSLNPGELLSLLVPRFPSDPVLDRRITDGFWHEKSLWIGVLPLLAAGLAWLDARRRGAALFFSVAALAALLAAMAATTPLHGALSWLPGYGSFRVPARVSWVFVLCLSVLAGLGWNAALESPWEGRRLRVFRLLCGIAGPVALALIWETQGAWESLGFAAAAALGIAALWLAPRTSWAAPAAVGLVAATLAVPSWFLLPRVERARYEQPPWYAAHIGPERSGHRLLDLGSFNALPTTHGFRLLMGYSYPMLRSTVELYARAWKDPKRITESLPASFKLADPAPLRALNVRWIVAPFPLPDASWPERARDGQRVLYEVVDPGPPAVLDGEGEVAVSRPDGDAIEIAVRAPKGGGLTLSEAWMPGWRGWIDGIPTAPASRDGLIRLELPTGASRVLLRYVPEPWRVGLWISGLSLAIPALLVLARRFTRVRVT